ncbi:hypothetical protein MTO96_046392 [Rhipicephalus appendiculatus]
MNVTSLQYGITAVGAEFSDSANGCGYGKFPLLNAIKTVLMFFKNSSGLDDPCKANGRDAQEDPTIDDQ